MGEAIDVVLWVSARTNSMNRMPNFSGFDAFSLGNGQQVDNFATGVWKLALAEGHTLCAMRSYSAGSAQRRPVKPLSLLPAHSDVGFPGTSSLSIPRLNVPDTRVGVSSHCDPGRHHCSHQAAWPRSARGMRPRLSLGTFVLGGSPIPSLRYYPVSGSPYQARNEGSRVESSRGFPLNSSGGLAF
jgi:hypothetical protein